METGCARGVKRGVDVHRHPRRQESVPFTDKPMARKLKPMPFQFQSSWVFHLAACEERLREQ